MSAKVKWEKKVISKIIREEKRSYIQRVLILLRKSLLPNIFLKGLGNCKMKSSSLNSYLRYRLLTFVSIIVAIAATKMSLSNMSSAITHNTVVSFFVYWKLDEIIVVFVVLKVTFSISRKKNSLEDLLNAPWW